MAMDDAKALVAKIHSDSALAHEFGNAANEAEFLEVARKHGYNVTVDEFKSAAAEAKPAGSGEISDEKLDQVAGGLSIVGVDYAFTAAQTSKK